MKKKSYLMKLGVIVLLSVLLVLAVSGCSNQNNQVNQNNNTTSEGTANQEGTILVSAAASLSVVMDDIIAQFKEEHANIKVEVNYGSSGTLQKQIEQGAPADLFVSAGLKQMKALEEQQLLEASTSLLKNEIVVVGSKDLHVDGDQTLTQLLETVNPKHIAIGEPDTVPAGQYAKQVLENEKLWDTWTKQYVYAKDVRQVLTYVEQGNAELGFVYLSDAVSSDEVKIVHHIDDSLHDPITYPVAILKNSEQLEAAQLFYEYLQNEELTALYEQNGFKRAE